MNLGDIRGDMFSDWWRVSPERSGSADNALTLRGMDRERKVEVEVGVKELGLREF